MKIINLIYWLFLFVFNSDFTKSCLPLLLQQDYTNKADLIADLPEFNDDTFSQYPIGSIYVLYISNLGSIPWIPFEFHLPGFTLNDMDNLAEQIPKLWKNDQFIELYIQKLMPIQISLYLNINLHLINYQQIYKRNVMRLPSNSY